jgi:hypothetical protein
MRAVLVGPYPPSADPGADAVLAEVRAWRAQGYSVEVISPHPSAAHHHARPDTLAGAIRIARIVRAADLVVMAALMPGRRRALVARRIIERALCRSPRVEWCPVRLDGNRITEEPAGARGDRLGGLPARLRAGAPTFVRSTWADLRGVARRFRRRARRPPGG